MRQNVVRVPRFWFSVTPMPSSQSVRLQFTTCEARDYIKSTIKRAGLQNGFELQTVAMEQTMGISQC